VVDSEEEESFAGDSGRQAQARVVGASTDERLMSEIMLRVKICPGGRMRYSTVRNRKGYIAKSVIPGQESKLFQWVYNSFGSNYANHIALK
jgi:hypothetical protein